MKEIYTKYMGILRSFVQGTAPDKLEGVEQKDVLELARINSTMGIFSYVCMSFPGVVDTTFQDYLRRQCLVEIGLYVQRVELAKLLVAELNKNGIDVILLKGFVVRDYYPVPELRSFGDVDIIINKEDRQKSDEMMMALGFHKKDDWEPSYSYVRGTEHYEFHSRVIGFDVSDKADFVDYFSHIWDYVQPACVVDLEHVWELKPEFHFVYLMTHIAKHINHSGAGVRMYLDLAFFIKHFGESLDWKWVAKEMEKLKLTDFAAVALSAVECWFGVENPMIQKRASAEMLEDFTEFTISGGVYGYVGRDQGEMFLKRQNRNEENISRFKTLLYHAFPPKEILMNKYAYLEKHSWLLPMAWGQRLIDKRKEWGRFADSTKQILNADEEKVLKLKRIYKEIGL